MRNKITQKLCSTLLAFTLVAGIITCSLSFIPSNEPPEPKKQLIEAPIGRSIRALVAWLKDNIRSGEHDGSSKGGPPRPE